MSDWHQNTTYGAHSDKLSVKMNARICAGLLGRFVFPAYTPARGEQIANPLQYPVRGPKGFVIELNNRPED